MLQLSEDFLLLLYTGLSLSPCRFYHLSFASPPRSQYFNSAAPCIPENMLLLSWLNTAIACTKCGSLSSSWQAARLPAQGIHLFT